MSTILAIETSCDETACAIVRGHMVLGSAVSSQIADHIPYGGVVPEIASRKHIEALIPVTTQALANASVSIRQIDAIAVTYGPGLIGALLTGLSFAKGLALSTGLPLIGVHHIEAHISANYIAHETLTPPYVCLVVSGGHSHLVKVVDYGVHELLARTLDDAAGEAFDKAARALGLPYPGGPHLDALAESGDPFAIPFKPSRLQDSYSFSGMKSGLLQAIAKAEKQGAPLLDADLAASFRKAVVDQLLDLAFSHVATQNLKILTLAGGVASNRLLRREATARGLKMGIQVLYPPPELCTDNASMVGVAAYHRMEAGRFSALDLNAVPSLVLP